MARLWLIEARPPAFTADLIFRPERLWLIEARPPAFTADLIFRPERLWLRSEMPPALTADLTLRPDFEVVFICVLLESFGPFFLSSLRGRFPLQQAVCRRPHRSKILRIANVPTMEQFVSMTSATRPYD